MKIAFTGGSTGGHFYPHIAVVEGIETICATKKLIEPQYFYFGPQPFDPTSLIEHDIEYVPVGGTSARKDGSVHLRGILSLCISFLRTVPQLFSVYPDVVFSTGSYAAFPTLLAARILQIPVVIYDADATPGKVSRWSSQFARWIAVAHPDAAQGFSPKYQDRIARTGHPIRKEIEHPAREGGYEFLKLDPNVPTLFVVGGSQGAQKMNETLMDALPMLLDKYNIIHQTGLANQKEVESISDVILRDSPYRERYRIFGLLNSLALKMAGGITELMVARAGSGTIFEIAAWGIPAILIPIPRDISHDQTENAFSYARAGAAVVIEQHNLTPHVLVAEIDRLMEHASLRQAMAKAAHEYARPSAGERIAEILLETALEHEPK